MEPRIANGPITKRSDADTKPSTKGLEPFGSNLPLIFTPITSKRLSISSALPISAPISRAANITRIGQPFGSSDAKPAFHNSLIASAAARSVTNPRAVIIRSRVFSRNLAPTRMPKQEPRRIARTFIVVPSPTKPTDIAQTSGRIGRL